MEREKLFGLLFKQIHDALEKRINNEMRTRELTFAQVRVLHVLYEKEDKTHSLKELERILGVAQSTCAGIVSRLVQKNMVECFTDPDDKRVKIVRITPEGERCCAASQSNLDQTERTILNGISEEDKALLYTLLQKVYQNVT